MSVQFATVNTPAVPNDDVAVVETLPEKSMLYLQIQSFVLFYADVVWSSYQCKKIFIHVCQVRNSSSVRHIEKPNDLCAELHHDQSPNLYNLCYKIVSQPVQLAAGGGRGLHGSTASQGAYSLRTGRNAKRMLAYAKRHYIHQQNDWYWQVSDHQGHQNTSPKVITSSTLCKQNEYLAITNRSKKQCIHTYR